MALYTFWHHFSQQKVSKSIWTLKEIYYSQYFQENIKEIPGLRNMIGLNKQHSVDKVSTYLIIA